MKLGIFTSYSCSDDKEIHTKKVMPVYIQAGFLVIRPIAWVTGAGNYLIKGRTGATFCFFDVLVAVAVVGS